MNYPTFDRSDINMAKYPPGPAIPGHPGVVIVNQVNQTALLPNDASFSNVSTKVACRQCGHPGMTVLNTHIGTATVCWAILLLPISLLGLICCCVDTCKDKTHLCAKCGSVVGQYKKPIC